MTYEENVRKVATEMAKALYSDFEYRTTLQQERYIQFCDSQSRIAISLISEAVITTIRIGFNPVVSKETISKHLIERGLIPDPEVTVHERVRNKIKQTKHWNLYPIGTRAYAINGGYWEKVQGKCFTGWKWCTGDTFSFPGADTNGLVSLPINSPSNEQK